MKESLLILIGVFFTLPNNTYATTAQGETVTSRTCVVHLEKPNGRIVDRFESMSCGRALQQCENDLRSYPPRRRSRLRCVVADRDTRPPQDIIDEVSFYHPDPSIALRDCRMNRAQDYRCTNSIDISCSPCSFNRHAEESYYSVYVDHKTYVDTFHAYSYNPMASYQFCENKRTSARECVSPRSPYFCGPCSFEPYNNHSQFNLYRK